MIRSFERVGALDVSRETGDRLRLFCDLLLRWSPRINLISASTAESVWSRHIADSAQLFSHAPEAARRWVDMGSGGGLPGAVVAILCAEYRPDLRVDLIESDQRKAVFLRTVARETGVPFKVHAARAEALAPLGADVLSARALAPLDRLLHLASHHLAPGGVCLFPKGARWASEVESALAHHRFHCEEVPSETSPEAVILKIGAIVRE